MSNEGQDTESESILPIDEHEEIVSEGGKKVRRRGVYLLPNLFTLAALFAGFYAVIAGMSGNFNEAGWAILVAAVCEQRCSQHRHRDTLHVLITTHYSLLTTLYSLFTMLTTHH